MASDKSNMSSILSTTGLPHDDGFIDDYSHLRLSYYQTREGLEDTMTSGIDETHYDPNLTESDVNTSCGSTQASFTSTFEDSEREKLRAYYIAQMPDIPPPSFTVASIISSASQKMNSGNINFKYDSQIEQGTRKEKGQDTDYVFTPNRRSTLNPQDNDCVKVTETIA